MTLNDYVRILRSHWIGVVLLVAAGLSSALLFNITQPKVYAANATGFVSTGSINDPALGSIGDTLAKSRAKSYVDIAQSRATAADVIQELGLAASPSELIGRISVNQPPDTVLIKITAQAPSAKAAQQLADAWVAALADQASKIDGSQGGKPAGSGLRVVPVESAALPATPVLPRTRLNLLIGGVIGLLLGFAYALARAQFDRRIRFAATVERDFGVPVMGLIPQASDLQRKPEAMATLAVLSRQERPGVEAEAFRKLRTNLAYMDVDHSPRRIVVTSPKEGDGKSTVAANLAAAIAVGGQEVILLDADLRRPTVAESLGLVEGVGLTDLLIGRVEIDEALQPLPGLPNLRVLASGRLPPNPSELLGTQTMRDLLVALAKRAIVVLDAPPLLPVTDAAVLTAISDGALVVISAGTTLDTELGAALNHLESVKGRALGVVFNRMTKGSASDGYYGGGYYRARTDAFDLTGAG